MWLTPPDTLILGEEEAHVWHADLELHKSSQVSYLNILSPDEKKRACEFRFAKDRRNFIIARGILRVLIGSYLEGEPAEISFHYNEFGKPRVANEGDLAFNVSHSQNAALFAFTKKRDVGVDVEFVNPDIEVRDIAAKFFSANEVRNLFALPEEQQALGFFNCWTRKEAFIKAIGEGLSFPLNQFSVSLEPDKPAKLLATDLDPEAVSHWSIYSLSPGANFVGCIAIEGFVREIKLWSWRQL